MIQLGLSGFYHDSAAALVINGKVIAAIEEEKLSGIKHDSSFPFKAIEWVLDYAKITIDEVDMVCWYEDPKLKFERVKKELTGNWVDFLKNSANGKWKRFLKRWWKGEGGLKKILHSIGYDGVITYTKHHLSHLAFSYYTSPFDNAIGISIDGVGESETFLACSIRGNVFSEIKRLEFPHSLGLVYSAFTAYLGFKPNEGEYKLMGLAPYGDAKKYSEKLDKISSLGGYELFEVNEKYFTYRTSETDMFSNKLINLIGFPPRFKDERIEQHHMDLAAAVQQWYETNFYFIINRVLSTRSSENLVLGGGSAYNGTANGKIKQHTSFKNVWIPFAPSDAGSAIGACLYQWHNVLGHPKVKGGDNQSPYLGPEWNIKVKDIMNYSKKLSVEIAPSEERLCEIIAGFIKKGKIVGWFQGRTEFGARALGNRSILGNPHLPDIRDRINKVVKKREMFRPFAPSVTQEDYQRYFSSEEDVPYMNQVVKVISEKPIPSVTHVDNSARIQTVTKEQNPLYYKLLKQFEKITGTPILLNTSFNLKDHTMTNDPDKALWTFLNCDMDILVINNFIIYK
jgi:carbamoyltransferase